MRKKIFIFVMVFLGLFLVSCSTNSDGFVDRGLDNEVEIVPETSPNRKIVYSVSTNIETTNMNETVFAIQELMGENDWIDNLEIYDNSHTTMILRIKTTDLNKFVNEIRGNYKTTNYQMSAKDVSIHYFDLANKIIALENEQERLLILYETANMQEIIQINERLATIETALQSLNKEINQYDSLIEYSTVTIRINQVSSTKEKGFFEQIKEGFVSGWNAFTTFIKYLIITLSYMLPWFLVLAPITLGVIFTVRHIKKNKKK